MPVRHWTGFCKARKRIWMSYLIIAVVDFDDGIYFSTLPDSVRNKLCRNMNVKSMLCVALRVSEWAEENNLLRGTKDKFDTSSASMIDSHTVADPPVHDL